MNNPETLGNEIIELRIAIAELKGEINRTPSKFDVYTLSTVTAGLFAGFLSALIFFYLAQSQRDFEQEVVRIFEAREEIRAKEFQIELEKLKAEAEKKIGGE